MILSILKNAAHRIGMDKSIAYSSGARIVQGIAGVGTVFFIGKYLSGIEQGFYFTFGSILALQVFFELGLTGIMTQFVAHESSHLTLNQNYKYEGNPVYLSRLASLVSFCIKWYAILAVIVFVFLLIVGYSFFNKYGTKLQSDINWLLPWVFVCGGTAIKLFQSPLTAILTGLGKVKDMSKIGFYQQLIIPLSTWICLALNLGLFVVGISYLLSVLIWQIDVYRKGLHNIFINLRKTTGIEKVSYKHEIFPYQWRIALSWISGYFIFQLFNPVLFATEGAVIAGQMGMTIHALNAILAFSMSWNNSKIPLYSKLIALKEYTQLDSIFNRTLKQMSTICFGLLLLMFLGICFLRYFKIQIGNTLLAGRFLPYIPMLFMMIPIYINQYVNAWATYLRCHKKEPYLIVSIVSGCLCCISTFTLGHLFGLYGITIGYCLITLLLMPWSYRIYRNCKIQWHEN